MKDYGRDGRLKPEKKKKRKFEVIMNTATKGIYSDFTPMKVAKKVTSELVGKKKQIIFHLREKGKSGKTYGYIGSIRDGKVVVRTHKMSGGEMGCVFNKITPNNFKVDKSDLNNPPAIAITKFCVTRTTIIFFCTENYKFLEKDGNKYYTYAIYREGDKVFVKKLMYDQKGELIATPLGDGDVGIGKIALDNIHERKKTLEEIKKAIEAKKEANKKPIAKDIYSAIDTYLKSVQSENNKEQPQQPQQSQSSINHLKKMAETTPINKLPLKVYNRLLNNSLKNQNPLYKSALLPQQLKSGNISNNKSIQPYICLINNPIEEFKVSTFSEIFFGFDINLLKILPDPPKLYYKYSYRGEKFYQLIEIKNGKLDESQPIDMLQIPLYDLLCLYEFAKSSNNNLFKKLCDDISEYKISYEKENPKITISFSEDKFSPLENKNFNKKQERSNTNIGKTKKTYGRKTYYFFGKNTQNSKKYKYTCYRDGTEVYYFEIGNIKEQKNLMDLQDRSALEDLKTFIILRRMKNPSDKKFGEDVYEKASEIIGQLKFKEIQNKIKPNQNQKLPVQFPVETPVQFPIETPDQFPVDPQKSKQPPVKFLNYFRSELSSPLPSYKKPQLQSQLPSTLVD